MLLNRYRITQEPYFAPMPTKKTEPNATHPLLCFVKELAGENPPSLGAMKDLYRVTEELVALRPWELLQEGQLILVPHPEGKDLCYCSVIGAMGEVFSLHAYIGMEGFRSFLGVASGQLTDPGEYLASLNCVYVEFAPKSELETPDRKLLSALGHPSGRNVVAPLYRAVRPGFHPWFVTSEDVRVLTACVSSVVLVCSEMIRNKKNFWPEADTFPLLVPERDGENPYRIELVKPVLPSEPLLPPARVQNQDLEMLKGRDYGVGGVIELDYIFSSLAVGKKSERKACTCIALAVDAESGLIYSQELADANVAPGDVLAKALLHAIKGSRLLPKELRVRSPKVKQCLLPLAESFDISIEDSARLPAFDEARVHLMSFLKRG